MSDTPNLDALIEEDYEPLTIEELEGLLEVHTNGLLSSEPLQDLQKIAVSETFTVGKLRRLVNHIRHHLEA